MNGEFNVQSYAPTIATGGDRDTFLSPFKNHLGYGIISPFIEYNTQNGNPNSSNYIVPSGSQILWQDEADIITIDGIAKESVTVKNATGVNQTYSISYLTFTIPQDKICQNNALLAVTDSEGKIMWSWHIWITNDPGLLQSAIPVRNFTNVTYNFFPLYNLGWIEPEEYQAREDIRIVLEQKSSEPAPKTITIIINERPETKNRGNGCYYQFGRKDPMCRVLDPLKNGGSGNFSSNTRNRATLDTSIQNPSTLYAFFNAKSHPYDWCVGPSSTTSYNNLWTGRFNIVGSNIDQNTDIIKTVYDPSPRGYKIPASNAFTGFTTTGEYGSYDDGQINASEDFNYGWYLYTEPNKSGSIIFFPAAGSYTSSSSISNFGYAGYYQTAIPLNNDYGGDMDFYSNSFTPKFGGARLHACSVRPVLE